MTTLSLTASVCFLPALIGEVERAFWKQENQCASWTVYHALCLRDGSASIPRIVEFLPIDRRAKSLAELRCAYRELGFFCAPTPIAASVLAGPPRVLVAPVRLYDGGIHFVLVAGWNDEQVFLLDGPSPMLPMPKREFLDFVVGVGLDLSRDSNSSAVDAWTNALGALIGASAMYVLLRFIQLLAAGIYAFTTTHRWIGAAQGLAVASLFATGCHRNDAPPESAPERLSLASSNPQIVEGKEVNGAYTGVADFEIVNPTEQEIEITKLHDCCGVDASIVTGDKLLPPQGRCTVRLTAVTLEYQPKRGVIGVETKPAAAAPPSLVIEVRPKKDSLPALVSPLRLEAGEARTSNPVFIVSAVTAELRSASPWLQRAVSEDSRITAAVEFSEPVVELTNVDHRKYHITFRGLSQVGAHVAQLSLLDSSGRVGGKLVVQYDVVPDVRVAPKKLVVNAGHSDSNSITRNILVQFPNSIGTTRLDVPAEKWISAKLGRTNHSLVEIQCVVFPDRLQRDEAFAEIRLIADEHRCSAPVVVRRPSHKAATP